MRRLDFLERSELQSLDVVMHRDRFPKWESPFEQTRRLSDRKNQTRTQDELKPINIPWKAPSDRKVNTARSENCRGKRDFVLQFFSASVFQFETLLNEAFRGGGHIIFNCRRICDTLLSKKEKQSVVAVAQRVLLICRKKSPFNKASNNSPL